MLFCPGIADGRANRANRAYMPHELKRHGDGEGQGGERQVCKYGKSRQPGRTDGTKVFAFREAKKKRETGGTGGMIPP